MARGVGLPVRTPVRGAALHCLAWVQARCAPVPVIDLGVVWVRGVARSGMMDRCGTGVCGDARAHAVSGWVFGWASA